MDERGRVLKGLDEVGRQCVTQQCRHRAGRADVVDRDRPAVAGVGDDDASQARPQVRHAGGQAEHGHDLARDDDVEVVLARDTAIQPAQADRRVTQRPVVQVHDAVDVDAAGIDVEGVAVVDVVVQHGRGQVVRQRDRVEVAGEVKVDVLHRHDLRVAAARGTALHTEHRSQAGLAQGEDGLTRGGLAGGDLAAVALVEPVRQTDAGRRLPLPRRGGAHRGDEDEPAGRCVRLETLEHGDRHLRLRPAVRDQVVGGQSHRVRDVSDPLQRRCLGDLQIDAHEAIVPEDMRERREAARARTSVAMVVRCV